MDYNRLAELLFPEVTETPEEVEARYPERDLPEGAKVTRMGPSPTGFMHLGNLYGALVDERLAHQSGGVFFLRIEDTDKKREVEGGVELILETFKNFGLPFDEGVTENGDKGNYGPYRQSQRAAIYHVFAKELVQRGYAYPCFCTEEELAEMHAQQEANKENFGYYGKYAKYRDCPLEEIERRIAAGESYVVRGEEWLATLPVHLQLFDVLGWKRPKYVHTAQLMKMDGGSKRKLSKRKDPELALSYYYQQGIPVPSVMEYLMTLLNSNFEEWRRANQTAPLDDFPFSTKKMSVSGSLFDMDKLHDVSKNVISRMSAEDVYDSVAKWSADNDPEFHALFVRDPEMTKKFLAIGRGGKKPRKDLALWSETKAYMDFMFDELFQPDYSGMPERAKADAKAILTEYQDIYDAQDEMTVWFDKVKALAERHGFAPETKLYKKNPEQYKGPVGDISMVLRVAICGRTNAPDLYSVMQLMPVDKIQARLAAACEAL